MTSKRQVITARVIAQQASPANSAEHAALTMMPNR
jgi:hypothetical protein